MSFGLFGSSTENKNLGAFLPDLLNNLYYIDQTLYLFGTYNFHCFYNGQLIDNRPSM